jgi:predicted TIM-barrel fold metal-dependent hydrolase
MIIDADTHISPTFESGNSIPREELIRRMDRAGVDRAVTWLQPPYVREVKHANAYVYEATKRFPDRILGFGWADPNLGVEKAREMVRRCLSDYGFHGVKLNGAQNDYYIDDPALSIPLVEEIARAGKAVAFHVGADSFEHTHPFRVAKIARRFPDLPILAVHMGGVAFHGMTDAMIEFAEECPNITLVGSAVRTDPILKAIHRLGASRVCFGSDTPFEPLHVEVARYNAFLEDEVNEAEKHLVMAGNILRLFGLSS